MSRTRSASRRAWSRSTSMRKPSLVGRGNPSPPKAAQRRVNLNACSTYNAAKVKQVPVRCRKSVVENLARPHKQLRKLTFQIVLGGLCSRQNRRDFEIIERSEAAD